MLEEILSKIAEKGNKLGLSETSKRSLSALARDPHGIERIAAPSMLASTLNISIDEANQSLLELHGKQLLCEPSSSPPRLYLDLERLGLTDQERELLIRRRTPYENCGAPHSERAMASLATFFDDTEGPIYVALEVTAPEIFSHLADRASREVPTTFLMPRKNSVPNHRRQHYDEVRQRWVKMIRDSDAKFRKNVEIRITEVPYTDLFTSALSKEKARFDLRFLDTGTTRDGDILEVQKNTSLYYVIRHRYEDALVRSCPLWKIWWGRAACHWGNKLILPGLLLLIGILLVETATPYAAVGSIISLGLLVNLLSRYIGFDKWRAPNLF